MNIRRDERRCNRIIANSHLGHHLELDAFIVLEPHLCLLVVVFQFVTRVHLHGIDETFELVQTGISLAHHLLLPHTSLRRRGDFQLLFQAGNGTAKLSLEPALILRCDLWWWWLLIILPWHGDTLRSKHAWRSLRTEKEKIRTKKKLVYRTCAAAACCWTIAAACCA